MGNGASVCFNRTSHFLLDKPRLLHKVSAGKDRGLKMELMEVLNNIFISDILIAVIRNSTISTESLFFVYFLFFLSSEAQLHIEM